MQNLFYGPVHSLRRSVALSIVELCLLCESVENSQVIYKTAPLHCNAFVSQTHTQARARIERTVT